MQFTDSLTAKDIVAEGIIPCLIDSAIVTWDAEIEPRCWGVKGLDVHVAQVTLFYEDGSVAKLDNCDARWDGTFPIRPTVLVLTFGQTIAATVEF